MSAAPGSSVSSTVLVRYWAAARAAAGVEADVVPLDAAAPLSSVLDEVRRRHADRPRLAQVMAVCSVLVGDRPVGRVGNADVEVAPGDVVELLPPFAGG